MNQPLLDVADLTVEFRRGFRQPPFVAVDRVSLDVRPGETLGLVGESGSGKTTIGRAILGLTPIAGGRITFAGAVLTSDDGPPRRQLARDLQAVFQDPYSSLNPMMTVGDILAEPLQVQGVGSREARQRVQELLDQVRLPTNAAQRLPREFSGGQRQRIAVARALALAPKLIVCDEPVSALDLTTQARVLDLLVDIQEQTGVAYLFISHDLSVVRHISHRVAVLLRGRIVEAGDCEEVTSDPKEPYTQRLLAASPVADPRLQAERRRAWLELTRPS
ncbi:MAG: ATP-binding cassette domain-containing protein [Acidimicrobiia bacterium]